MCFSFNYLAGITERTMARYMFRICYAEGLPKMSTDTVGKVKKVFTGTSTPYYIQRHFLS